MEKLINAADINAFENELTSELKLLVWYYENFTIDDGNEQECLKHLKENKEAYKLMMIEDQIEEEILSSALTTKNKRDLKRNFKIWQGEFNCNFNKRRKDNKRDAYVEPQGGFLFPDKIGITKEVQEAIRTLSNPNLTINLDSKTRESIEDLVGIFKTNDDVDGKQENLLQKLLDTMNNLQESAASRCVNNVAGYVNGIFKGDVSSPVTNLLDFGFFVFTVSTILNAAYYRTTYDCSLATMTVGLYTIYGCLNDSKTIKSICSQLSKLGGVISKIVNKETGIVEPQFDSFVVDKVAGAVATVLGSYASFTSGRDIPSELFKNVGNMTRVSNTFADIVKGIIECFEGVINWIRVDIMKGKGYYIMETRSAVINDFLKDMQILEEENRLGNLDDTFDNACRVSAMRSAAFDLMRITPRNSETNGVISLIQGAIFKLERYYAQMHAGSTEFEGTRQEPVGLLFRGGPGCGKTITMEHVYRAFLAATLDPVDYEQFERRPADFVYNRQSENKYWDSYTNKKRVTLFDDFGQAIDVAGTPDNEYMDIIRCVNVFENILHRADMDSKGKSKFFSTLVIATTNHMEFRPQSIHQADALNRRFILDFIVTPKLKYCIDDHINSDPGYEHRKVDPNKLPKEYYEVVDDVVTILDPSCQEFIRRTRGGYSDTRIYTFDEVMELVLKEHNKRKAWYLTQKEQFNATAKRYREKYDFSIPDACNVIPMDSIPGVDNSKKACDVVFDCSVDMVEAQSGRGYHNFFTQPPTFKDDDISLTSDLSYQSAMVCPELPQVDWEELFAPESIPFDRSLVNAYDNNVVCYARKKYDDMGFPVPEARTKAHEILSITFRRTFGVDMPCVEIALCELLVLLGEKFFVMHTTNDFLTYVDLLSKTRKIFKYKHRELPNVGIFSQLRDYYHKVYNHMVTIGLDNDLVRMYKSIVSSPLYYIIMSIAGSMTAYGLYSMLCNYMGVKPEPCAQSKGPLDRSKASKTKVKTPGQVRTELSLANKAQSGIDTCGEMLTDKLVSTNQYSIYVESDEHDGYSKLGSLLFITNYVAVMPYHFFTKLSNGVSNDANRLSSTIRLHKAGCTAHAYAITLREFISSVETERLLELDLCLIDLHGQVQPHRNILKNISAKDSWGRQLTNIPYGISFMREHKICKHAGYATAMNHALPYGNDEIGDVVIPKYYTYMGNTDAGDCGSAFFVYNKKEPLRKIGAIHVAGIGSAGISYASPLFIEDVEADLSLFEKRLEIDFEEPDQMITAQSSDLFGVKHFGELGILDSSAFRNTKTSIMRSRMHGTYYTPTKAPVKLTSMLDKYEIFYGTLTKYCKGPVVLSDYQMRIAYGDLTSFLAIRHPTKFKKELIDYMEVAYGSKFIEEIRGIPLNTSPGYPYNLPSRVNFKKQLALIRDDPERVVKFGHLIEPVKKQEFMLHNNTRPFFLYTDFLKDELRDFGKSPRLVSGAGANLCMLFGRYFGAFVSEFQNNKIFNYSAIGVNAYSNDWDFIARELGSFDFDIAQVGAGDFKGLDATECPKIHGFILEAILDWYGRDKEADNRVRRLLWYEITNSRHMLEDLYMTWSGSLPSGNPMTATINTLYVLYAFMHCFRTVCDENGLNLSFHQNVKMIILGDDHVFSVHKVLRPYLNEMTLVGLMSDIGLIYTTEMKGEAFVPFRRLDEIEFLKRSFRKVEHLNRWVAPIRLEVILNTPCWTKRGSNSETIPAENVVSSIKELSLHPKHVYDEWAPKIIDSFRLHYPMLNTSIPLETSYEDLQNMVLNKEKWII